MDNEHWRANGLRLGILNIISLKGKVDEIIDVMKQRKIDIFGLSEVKWKGKGEKKCREGYTVFWSGNERVGINGVAFIVNKRVGDIIEEVKYVNDRIITISFKNRNRNINIIQVYAPQSGCSDDIKMDFEVNLENTIARTKGNVVMGDFNAQVGKDRMGYEEVLGAFGFGNRNDEGERLLDLCQRNGYKIGNSFYLKKRESHVITRYSWDGVLKSVIDYVLVDRSWEHKLNDVKVIPSVSIGSDHRLLIADIALEIERPLLAKGIKKIKHWKLKEKELNEDFKQLIASKLPRTEAGNIEDEWKDFKTTFIDAAEKTCGRTSGKIKQKETRWWNKRTEEAVSAKNKAFRKYWSSLKRNEVSVNLRKEEYIEEKRKCRRIIKEEKDKSWKEFTNKMVLDMNGNKKMFFNMMRNKKKQTQSVGRMESLDGRMILDRPEEIKILWAEYFRELLNDDTVMESKKTQQDQRNEENEVEELALNELENVIKTMKTNKAAGPDEITVDLIKAAGPVGIHWLFRIFKCIWREKRIPDEWGFGDIVTLFKKGNRKQCKNYRGITLMCQCAKIFERVVLNRIKEKIERELSEEQHGFRPGRSTVDLIFAIRQIIEKKWEYGKNIIMVFIDIEKAYDSVLRESIWDSLGSIGIAKPYIDWIREMYRIHKCRVRTNFGNTDWFDVNKGLKQGSVLSPYLFNVVMECITRNVKKKFNGNMRSMVFADDLMIWGERADQVQLRLDEWNRQMKMHGLKISTEKSEVMVIGRSVVNQTNMTLDNIPLRNVDTFSYLGTKISKDGRIEHEISNRLSKGGSFYQSIKHLVWDKMIPRNAKMIMFKSYYLPIIMYGAETWAMTERQWSRIGAGEMKFLRSVLGKTKMDRIRNMEIRDQLNVSSFRKKIENNRIRWLGHVKRMDNTRLPKKMLEKREEGKRPRGRPRKRWIEEVKKDIEARGYPWMEVVREELWNDRLKWRGLVNS